MNTKFLQHVTEIDPSFSEKEEIEKQLDKLEKKESKIIQIPFNWKWLW